MSRFGRDKASEISRRRWSQDLLMTADIDAKLPERPSLEGCKVEVLSLESVVHLFKERGDQFALPRQQLEDEQVRAQQTVRANIGLMHSRELTQR